MGKSKSKKARTDIKVQEEGEGPGRAHVGKIEHPTEFNRTVESTGEGEPPTRQHIAHHPTRGQREKHLHNSSPWVYQSL